jgi:glycosyltransferase involved in cell wall biosynthesis
LKPTVSVIIPAYNAAVTLPRCLAAVRAMTIPPDEIILFDDGSADETAGIAERAGIRVIGHPGAPLGPAHGRNLAASAATSDLLLFVDADVVIEPAALERLLAALDAYSAQAAFGSYDDQPASRRSAALYANLRHHFVHQHGKRDASTFWAGLGLIERRVFIELGGYDEARFSRPSIEDIEFGMRLIASGGRVRLVPEAQGKHLKDWRLLQLWRTDILLRAYPWACLIVDGENDLADLNVKGAERLKAVVATAALLLLAAGIVVRPFLWGGLVLVIVYLWLNRSFFALLARRGSPLAFVQGVLMHACYHVYSAATFGFVRLTAWCGLRHKSEKASRLPLPDRADDARTPCTPPAA